MSTKQKSALPRQANALSKTQQPQDTKHPLSLAIMRASRNLNRGGRMNFKKPLPRPLTELTEGISISEKGLPQALTKLTKGVDRSKTLDYSGTVAEKEATGFGDSNKVRRTTATRRLFFVRMPTHVLFGRALVGIPSGMPDASFSGSPTPLCARSPVWRRDAGLSHLKEAHMPGTSTSQHSPSRNTHHSCLYIERELAAMLREFAKMSGHDQAAIYQSINQRVGGTA